MPNGPVISSVFGNSVVVTSCFRFAGGSRNLISTPCGVVKGARPIRDWHLEVLVNDRDGCGAHSAGMRKSGSSIEAFTELTHR